jgi:pimeloyl-ACP methyl ester carboxylesterase
MPWFTRLWFWWLYARHVGKKDEQLEAMIRKPLRVPKMFCETDRKLWNDPQIRKHDLLDHLEAFRQGTKGPVYEAGLWGQPWGFRIEEITFGKVYLWHGEKDLNSPVESVRAMAARLPQCETHYYPEYGHSVGSYYWDEILQTIAS